MMASDNEIVSSEPDFSEFADWHVTEQDEEWPPYFFNTLLSSHQSGIVARNVFLLLDVDAWVKKTQAFEAALLKIRDETARKNKRAEFVIHFNCFRFPSKFYAFNEYIFPCSVFFDEATFEIGDVSFQSAIFKGDVSFGGVNFGGGLISFYQAAFEGDSVSFDGAVFDGEYALFNEMQLNQAYLSFSDMVVKGNFSIYSNTYFSAVSFQRLSVGGTAIFLDSTFHKAPDFTNSKLDRAPDISEIEVLTFKEWKLWFWPWWKADENLYGDGLAAKFRKLKAMALAANDHEKDGEFFAYEMLAKRGYEAGSSGLIPLFINWLYFIFSNFGQSYVRPAIALGLNFFIFFVINAITAAPFLKPTDLSSFAFWQSFKNMIPFLNSLIRFASRPDEFKSTYELAFNQLQSKGASIEFFINAGIFQNFIGLILLFLFLLGLRNKFRLK